MLIMTINSFQFSSFFYVSFGTEQNVLDCRSMTVFVSFDLGFWIINIKLERLGDV